MYVLFLLATLCVYSAKAITLPTFLPDGARHLQENGILATNQPTPAIFDGGSNIAANALIINKYWVDGKSDTPGATEPNVYGVGSAFTGLSSITSASLFAVECMSNSASISSDRYGFCDPGPRSNEGLTLRVAEITKTGAEGAEVGTASITFEFTHQDASDFLQYHTWKQLDFVFPQPVILNPAKVYALYIRGTTSGGAISLRSSDDTPPSIYYRDGVFDYYKPPPAVNDNLYGLHYALNAQTATADNQNVIMRQNLLYDSPTTHLTEGVSIKSSYVESYFSFGVWNPSSSSSSSYTLTSISLPVKGQKNDSYSESYFQLDKVMVFRGTNSIANPVCRTTSTDISSDRFTALRFVCDPPTEIEPGAQIQIEWYTDAIIDLEMQVTTRKVSGGYESNFGLDDESYVPLYEINAASGCAHGAPRACGGCKCDRDLTAGYWAGDSCDECAEGFHTSECNKYCVDDQTCNGQGTCSTTTGECECTRGYTGRFCQHSTVRTK